MKFSSLIVFVPVATVAALFAVANRQDVILSFDPFASGDAFSFVMPLYALVFVSLILGVILGGATVALNRRAAQRRRFKTNEIGDAIVRIDSDKPEEPAQTHEQT